MASARKRRLLAAASVLGILIVASIAYAYWSATGSGAGSGVTSDPGAQGVSINQTSSVAGLYPGASAPLSGNFDNAAANDVHVNAVTASVTGTDKPGCTAADYQITGTSSVANGGMVPSGTGTGGWSGLTLTMLDTGVNQDACKGATVNIAYSAN